MKNSVEILDFIQSSGVSILKIAKDTGVSSSNLYKWVQKKNKPDYEQLLIVDKYLSDLDLNANKNSAPATDYLQERRSKKLAVNNFLVPLIPVKAQAGFIRAVDPTVYIDQLEKYALPPGIDPYGAVWAYWEIQGDSMEPTFYNGDYILATQVPRMDWDQLRQFYTYIIVTEEKILIKRVFTKNELEWVLISDNEEKYPQQLLPAESVKQVWVFRRHIDSKAPPPKKFEIKV